MNIPVPTQYLNLFERSKNTILSEVYRTKKKSLFVWQNIELQEDIYIHKWAWPLIDHTL
jgi:hypothetical protein